MGGIHLPPGIKRFHGLTSETGSETPPNQMIELPDALNPLGLTPGDISHVVMTHLEYDHANGLADPEGNPYCPNADHLVRAGEFSYSQHGPFSAFYNGKLLADLKEKLGKKWIEIPGKDPHWIIGELELKVSGGHTEYHQIIEGLGFWHLGDLMHDEHVLGPDQFNCYARNMDETYRFKARLLARGTFASPDGFGDVVFFNHGHRHHAGRIKKADTERGPKYTLLPINLNEDLEAT